MIKKTAFTLVELLIILILVVIIIGIIVLVAKPIDFFQKSKDQKRESDLKNFEKFVSLMTTNDPSFNELSYVSTNTLYLSLKDSSSTCGTYLSQLPSLPSGWSYRCSATPTDITGQGWLPFPFSSNPLINLSQLPIDPINKPPYYYTFTANQQGYELTAKRENKDEEIIISNSTIRLTPISRGGTWLKTYGAVDADLPYSIQKTSDNGYLIFGNTYSCCNGNYDIFILKLDAGGHYQWAKTIGSTYWDTVYSSYKTSDGGFILGGYTSNYGAVNGDAFIIKLDSDGQISWSKRIGTNNQEYIYNIKQTSDGGYIGVGYISSGSGDILVFKLLNDGSVSWAKRIGGSYTDEGYFIMPLSDGGYLLTARTFSSSGPDVLIIKLDNNGDILWSKEIRASAGVFLYDGDIVDDNYLLTGWIQDNTYGGFGGRDMVILNFATSGVLNWSKILGDSSDNEFKSMIKTNDNNYVLVGTNIVKVDKNGNLLWSRGLRNNFYFLNTVIQNLDGSYLAAGYYDNNQINYNYDISLFKLNYNGKIDKCTFLTDSFFSSLSAAITPLNVSPSIFSVTLSVSTVNIGNLPDFSLRVSNFCPAY